MQKTFKCNNMMGVINITPNSFSDGGQFTSPDTVITQVNKLYKNGCRIFDFGAQSTAPMNGPITYEEEVARFKSVLPELLEAFDFTDCIISIDTYRPATFSYLMENYFKDSSYKVIWNDVSGRYDEQVVEVLERYPEALYVLSHTNVPNREKTHVHMDYVSDKDIYFQVKEHLSEGLAYFEKANVKSRIVIDPCFGFSKSLQQNYDLLSSLNSLIELFSNNPWLIGISKKSFLRQMFKPFNDEDPYECAEYAHAAFLMQFMNSPALKIFRVHNSMVYQASLKAHSVMIENVRD